ncbi:MAG TPA: histidinol dehydrogenase [Dehalococcoidia bacterium]|nr:histidinol dehydrogenase [Dehalococcoidia bacterium]
MRIVEGASEARRTILRRPALDEVEVPEHLRARDRALFGPGLSVEETVARIVRAVRDEGDAAVQRFNEALDGSAPRPLCVAKDEIRAAYRDPAITPELVSALREAAARIRTYHEAQLRHAQHGFHDGGLGQVVRPLQRAGVYMPGSAVVYPSSLLMTALPAIVAGVEEVYVCSAAGPDGRVPAIKLVAAEIAGCAGVFACGGAQAVAALAYGTESVPRVDKICGPGNIFVTLAKRRVIGVTGIDALYGPTETLVIADETADPVLCAADLIAQAEHDEIASPILITDSHPLAERVAIEVERQLKLIPRGPIAAAAFANRGGAVIARDMDEAFDLANEYAPEHMCLLMRDAGNYTERVRNAGGLFVGESSPEALADYIAGPSHVMPTGGSARYASPLTVSDFLKVTSVVALGDADLERLGPAAARIAHAEGLAGHARAIEVRLESR